MLNTLSYIGEKLNSDVLWGVGASLLLNQYSLIDKPHDIDIVLDIRDIEKADEILKNMGKKKQSVLTTTYSTKYFYEYKINGIDVDVMAGFAINHINGVYEYTFDHNSVSEYREINGTYIPFISLEDWYVIYQLIPNSEPKVKMIENYLLSNCIKKPLLLMRALEGNLPIEVRNRIKTMLSA